MATTAIGKTLPALSIREPFASAVLLGIKPVENRSWKTEYRGPLLIHASKKFADSYRDANIYPDGTPLPDGYYFGCLIGIVDLAGIYSGSSSPFWDNPWANRKSFHLHLSKPRFFADPLEMPGQVRLFQVSVTRELRRQIEGATTQFPAE
jgi:ASCH domain